LDAPVLRLSALTLTYRPSGLCSTSRAL
jgi:hypothetical protein